MNSITPKGVIGRISRMAGGLLLLLCMLRPVAGVELETISANLSRYRLEAETVDDTLTETNDRLVKKIIEEKSAAYSEKQAALLGIDCTISILCNVGEDGMPYPDEALVEGTLSPEEKKKLKTMLEADLAIGPDRVYWKAEQA